MKKIFSFLVLILTFVVSCGNNNNSKKMEEEYIKIAVPEPLTGSLSQYGISISHGIELKANQINENGGILGKKIKLYIPDTKGDLQEAVNAVKELIANENINFILAESISANSSAVANLANKAKMVMITPAGTAYDITENRPYVFRATFTDPYQGVAIANRLYKKGFKKVALLTNDSNDYSVGVSEAFKKQMEKLGVKKVYEYTYTKEDTDFKSTLTTIKNLNVDVVVVPDYYNTVGLMLSQAKEVGLNKQFYGGDGWDGITVNFGDVANGSIFIGQFSKNDDDPIVQNFIKSYNKAYTEDVTIFAALGYDAMSLLADAIKKAGTLDTEKVREALQKIDSTYVTGKIRFGENNNPEKDVKFLKVVDGKTKVDK